MTESTNDQVKEKSMSAEPKDPTPVYPVYEAYLEGRRLYPSLGIAAADTYVNEKYGKGTTCAWACGDGYATARRGIQMEESFWHENHERRLKYAEGLDNVKNAPAAVRQWAKIFAREGYSDYVAMQKAIDRSFQSGEITEKQADRLDIRLKAKT